MKLITISKIGYNPPSGANWAYGIWKLDLIDTDKGYCMSHVVKETFGGNSRLSFKVQNELKKSLIETKDVYTSTGRPKITGVAQMFDIESEEVFNIIKQFYN